jgi:hypothetical protein
MPFSNIDYSLSVQYVARKASLTVIIYSVDIHDEMHHGEHVWCWEIILNGRE